MVAVLTAADVPGINDASPFAGDDPIFAGPVVEYAGQPIFAVAAESREQAIMAADMAVVGYEDLDPVLTLDQALERNLEVLPTHELCLGDPEAGLERAPHRLARASAHRRTGPLLSGRPDRPGPSRARTGT